MDTLSGVSIGNTVIPVSHSLQLRPVGSPSAASAILVSDDAPSNVKPSEGVKVTLSVEGLNASDSASKAKESPEAKQAKLIEKIQALMKKLQQQIQDQIAQLQAVQADRHLSADEKTQRISAITQQLAGLNAAFSSATAQLMEALKVQKDTGGGDAIQPLPFVQHTATDTTLTGGAS